MGEVFKQMCADRRKEPYGSRDGSIFTLAYCFLGRLNFAQGSHSSFYKSRSDEGVAKCELSEFRRKLFLRLAQSHYAPSWSLDILTLIGIELMGI